MSQEKKKRDIKKTPDKSSDDVAGSFFMKRIYFLSNFVVSVFLPSVALIK